MTAKAIPKPAKSSFLLLVISNCLWPPTIGSETLGTGPATGSRAVLSRHTNFNPSSVTGLMSQERLNHRERWLVRGAGCPGRERLTQINPIEPSAHRKSVRLFSYIDTERPRLCIQMGHCGQEFAGLHSMASQTAQLMPASRRKKYRVKRDGPVFF